MGNADDATTREIKTTFSQVLYDGKQVPQLRIEKQTLAGLESVVITRTTEKTWAGDWTCDRPQIPSAQAQMLLMYDVEQVVKNIQRACTGSEDARMRELLAFCPALHLYANKCITERGN